MLSGQTPKALDIDWVGCWLGKMWQCRMFVRYNGVGVGRMLIGKMLKG